MNPEICAQLAALNRVFYARFGDDFARTRRGRPPGFDRILPYLRPAANVLDLGCGNGRLLGFLAERGWRGRYLGVDSSAELLASARSQAPAACEADWLWADLLSAPWPARLAAPAPDAIASLAVLHHVPGAAHRAGFVARCAALLPPGGLLILSTWQFMTSPRLRARVLPWAAAGLTESDVEAGDYLLGWGAGAAGVPSAGHPAGQRYCAFIDEQALSALAAEAGLEQLELFRDDGHEGDLNLYGVFVTARRRFAPGLPD